MADGTGIQWTNATWNVAAGCAVVSPGCTNCYAMRMAARLEKMNGPAGAKYAGLTQPSKAGPVWTGAARPDWASLKFPLRWKKPRMVFVNSMSDLFHEGLSFDDIDRVFEVMRRSPQHRFQVLTKRADRMRVYMVDRYSDSASPANVWLGVSVEDQRRADERVPILLQTPAAIRFLSCEPLLGAADLATWIDLLDWVIVGGESGPGARPMHPDWARSLRDQCAAAGVPFFFKQWGRWRVQQAESDRPCGRDWSILYPDGVMDIPDGRWPEFEAGECWVESVSKKASGAMLDGVEHRAFPS